MRRANIILCSDLTETPPKVNNASFYGAEFFNVEDAGTAHISVLSPAGSFHYHSLSFSDALASLVLMIVSHWLTGSTGDWQFLMFDNSPTTSIVFYAVGMICQSGHQGQSGHFANFAICAIFTFLLIFGRTFSLVRQSSIGPLVLLRLKVKVKTEKHWIYMDWTEFQYEF